MFRKERKPIALAAVVTALLGCYGPRITSTYVNTVGFAHPCLEPGYFDMTVARGNTTPVISLPTGWLLANGESIRMVPPADGSAYGKYTYSGPIPYDGAVRYRYVFTYISGLASGGTDKVIRNPEDSYNDMSVGEITWTGSSVDDLPNSSANPPFTDRPRRILLAGSTYISPFNGPRTVTAELTLINNESVPLVFYQPEVLERVTNAALPDVTIAVTTGVVTYPMTLAAGASVSYTVSFTTDVTDGQTYNRAAGLYFPFESGIGVCRLGPIWFNAHIGPIAP